MKLHLLAALSAALTATIHADPYTPGPDEVQKFGD